MDIENGTLKLEQDQFNLLLPDGTESFQIFSEQTNLEKLTVFGNGQKIVFCNSKISISNLMLCCVQLLQKDLAIENLTIVDLKIDYPLPKPLKSLKLISNIEPFALLCGGLLPNYLKGINLIPACGEFVYETELRSLNLRSVDVDVDFQNKHNLFLECAEEIGLISADEFLEAEFSYEYGTEWLRKSRKPIHVNSHPYFQEQTTDAVKSIKQLKNTYPHVKWISIAVAWFGDSLDVANCQIYPAVEEKDLSNLLPKWHVAEFSRETAHLIGRDSSGKPNYGGTPDDSGLLRYLEFLHQENFKILFYPMIFIDSLSKPWRGHLTGSHLKVDNFFTKENGYNRFIFHYANLVKGKIDGFAIGSELVGLTKINDSQGNYPAVQNLISIATEVKAILGNSVVVTYAADWSEYHHTDGGMRPLDKLWAHDSIDVVGIDAYFPLTNFDYGNIDPKDISDGWASGEGYTFYFDGKGQKSYLGADWAWKDLEHWWGSEHWDGLGKKTDWQPKQKKIWFTEMGFPSIDKSPNQPNIFFNPECSDGGIPKFSDGAVNFDIQKKALLVSLQKIAELPFIENVLVWCWDARCYPAFPMFDTWSDKGLWPYGHWLNGKEKFFSSGNIRILEDIEVENLTVFCNNLFVDRSISALESIHLEIQNELVFHDSALRFIHGFQCTVPINQSIHSKLICIKAAEINFAMFSKIDSFLAPILTMPSESFAEPPFKQKSLPSIKADNLSILTNKSTFYPLKISIKDRFLLESKNNIKILSHQNTQLSKGRLNSKTTFLKEERKIDQVFIEAGELIIKSSGKLDFTALNIKVKQLLINCQNMLLDSAIQLFKYKEAFQGKRKVITGNRRTSKRHEVHETPVPTTIYADIIGIDVIENFTAKGVLIHCKKLESYAQNVCYLPKYLKDFINISSSTPHGLLGLGGTKIHQNTTQGHNIFGSVICVDDTYYCFAENDIHILASTLIAGYPFFKAGDKLILEAEVGLQTKHVKIQKSGLRLKTSFGGGEYSFGVQKYYSKQELYEQKQILFPSVLQGRHEMYLNAPNISQIASYLNAPTGNIIGHDWFVSHMNTSVQLDVKSQMKQLGIQLGIQESISSTVKNIQAAIDSLFEIKGPDSVVNCLSKSYKAFRQTIGVLTSGGIQGGLWLSGSNINSGSRMNILIPNFSIVDFEQLNVKLTNDFCAEGVNIYGKNLQIQARNILIQSTQEHIKNEFFNSSINGQIGLTGNIQTNINAQGAQAQTITLNHLLNRINLINKLSLEAEESIYAQAQIDANDVYIKGKKLSILSKQDTHKQCSFSGNAGVNLTSFSPNMAGNIAEYKEKVTHNQSYINAREQLMIKTQQLEMQSAKISNIDKNNHIGNNLHISAQNLILSNNRDIRQGYELGRGFSGGGEYFGDEHSLQLGRQNQYRNVQNQILGTGNIEIGAIKLTPKDLILLGINTTIDLQRFVGQNWRIDVSYAQANINKIQEAIGSNPLETLRNNFINAATDSLQNTFGMAIEEINSYFEKSNIDKDPVPSKESEDGVSKNNSGTKKQSGSKNTIKKNQKIAQDKKLFIEEQGYIQNKIIVKIQNKINKHRSRGEKTLNQKLQKYLEQNPNASVEKQRLAEEEFLAANFDLQMVKALESEKQNLSNQPKSWSEHKKILDQNFHKRMDSLTKKAYESGEMYSEEMYAKIFPNAIDQVGAGISYLGEHISKSTSEYGYQIKAKAKAVFSSIIDNLVVGGKKLFGKEKVEKVVEKVEKVYQKYDSVFTENMTEYQKTIIKPAFEVLALGAIGKIVEKTSSTAQIVELAKAPVQLNKAKNHTESFSDILISTEGQKLYAEYKGKLQKIVEKRVDCGIIKLNSQIEKSTQINELVKKLEKNLFIYQSRPNIDYIKNPEYLKLVGNPQKTGTVGHREVMSSLATKYITDKNVDFVFLDQGLAKIFGDTFGMKNFRIDVVVLKKELSEVKMFEVRSATQRKNSPMRHKLEAIQTKLDPDGCGTLTGFKLDKKSVKVFSPTKYFSPKTLKILKD